MGKRSTHLAGAIGADRQLGGEAAATPSGSEAGQSLATDPEPTRHECRRRRRPKYPPKTVIEALRASGGIKSTAAAKLGCSRNTLDSYIRQNPEIAEALAEIEEENLDLAESVVRKAMLADNLSAAFFYPNNKGARRGYGRKREHGDESRTGENAPSALDPQRTIDLQRIVQDRVPPDARPAFLDLLDRLPSDDDSSNRR